MKVTEKDPDKVLSNALTVLGKAIITGLKADDFKSAVLKGESGRNDFIETLCGAEGGVGRIWGLFNQVFEGHGLKSPLVPELDPTLPQDKQPFITKDHDAFLRKISGELFDGFKKDLKKGVVIRSLEQFFEKLAGLVVGKSDPKTKMTRVEKIVDKAMKALEKELKPTKDVNNPNIEELSRGVEKNGKHSKK